jgi:hypothetical protein
MSSCPTFDDSKFRETLNILDQANPDDHIMESLKEMSQESCPTSGGKKRKGRRFRGGQLVTRRNIKVIIYLILAGLVALASTSPNVAIFTAGIGMMLNGQCGNFANRLWGPFQNPVCLLYNNLAEAVLRALAGDATSIAMLTGAATLAIGAPVAISTTIDNIAGRIEAGVNGNMARLENGSQAPQITNSGGKSKRKTHRRKHTRKHKKTNKRRKH